MSERQPPMKNCWGGDRMCCGCGQQIVPREQAWMTGFPGHNRFYHTDCLVKFLWGAWCQVLDRNTSTDRHTAESEAKMWRGNHAYMVQLNKGLRAKLAAIDAERHRLADENAELRNKYERLLAEIVTMCARLRRHDNLEDCDGCGCMCSTLPELVEGIIAERDKLPKTADGVTIAPGTRYYWPAMDDENYDETNVLITAVVNYEACGAPDGQKAFATPNDDCHELCDRWHDADELFSTRKAYLDSLAPAPDNE